MSTSDVTKDGVRGVKPGRDAMVGVAAGRQDGARGARRRGGEQSMVPDAKFSSYYGKPVLNAPVWKAPDIAGYFFLGGLSGAASVLGACASVTRRPALAKASKVGAFASISLGLVGLVHDLGRPSRFVNMLRVFKPTSPMSVGSWALAGYGPAAGAAALSAVTGRMKGCRRRGHRHRSRRRAVRRRVHRCVDVQHRGPVVARGVSRDAVRVRRIRRHRRWRPWHARRARRGGRPARHTALFGAALELAASRVLTRRLPEPLSEPYESGKSGTWLKVSETLTALGAAGSVLLGRRNRAAAAVCGLALLAGSALSRFAIFEAGLVSANDPEHTVRPQRERLNAKRGAPRVPPRSEPARHTAVRMPCFGPRRQAAPTETISEAPAPPDADGSGHDRTRPDVTLCLDVDVGVMSRGRRCSMLLKVVNGVMLDQPQPAVGGCVVRRDAAVVEPSRPIDPQDLLLGETFHDVPGDEQHRLVREHRDPQWLSRVAQLRQQRPHA